MTTITRPTTSALTSENAIDIGTQLGPGRVLDVRSGATPIRRGVVNQANTNSMVELSVGQGVITSASSVNGTGVAPTGQDAERTIALGHSLAADDELILEVDVLGEVQRRL